MTGINAQTNMEFEAFIKFCGRAFFRERYCLREGILLCKINFFEQRLVTFSFFCHFIFLLVVMSDLLKEILPLLKASFRIKSSN